MAQAGDTITFGFTNGSAVKEDISNVNTAEVVFCDGPGGTFNEDGFKSSAGSGGRVENATIDLSGRDNLFIFVGGANGQGRYGNPNSGNPGKGGGTTEISFKKTDQSDSDDEPFLVAAGGGGGHGGGGAKSGFNGSDGGSREGTAGGGGVGGAGIAPPLGGTGNGSSAPTDGRGAIDDKNRGLVTGGTTVIAGGAGSDEDGSVKISFSDPAGPSTPAAPSNLSLTEV